MNRTRGISLSAVAVVSVLALTINAGGARASGITQHNDSGAGVDFSQDQQANSAASDLSSTLLATVPQLKGYAGLEIVAKGIEISTVGSPSPELLSAVQSKSVTYDGLSIPVLYRQVERSEETLTNLTDLIFADRNKWKSQGIELTTWAIDIETNTVLIHLKKYTSTSKAALIAAYGDGISVFESDYELAPRSRYNDSPAWYGGDNVVTPTRGCTSYFSLYSTGNKVDYNATAGHCGLGEVTTGGRIQGTAVASRQKWTDGGSTDVELWPVSSNYGRIWSDPTSVSRAVTSRSTGDPVGTILCVGGSYTGELCRIRLNSTGAYATYAGKTIKNQVQIKQMDNVSVGQNGDSGAPVYQAVQGGNQAKAFGMYLASGVGDSSEGVYTPQRYIFAAYSNLTFKPYSG